MRRLILASGSPRRCELLRLFGVDFEVRPPEIDESRHPDENPHAYVERLAREKAVSAAEQGTVALGGDTVVVHRGVVLGKPVHPAEARTMLRSLSGEDHHVVSGVAAATIDEGRLVVESLVESAVVRFAEMTDGEIDGYVATGEPLDKAGAYAIQERGGMFVDSIVGHPSTVAGLPLPATRRLLARHGLAPGGAVSSLREPTAPENGTAAAELPPGRH